MIEWSKLPIVEIKMLKGQAGGATWGNIDGTITNQSDLMAYLDEISDIVPITDSEIDDIVGV